VHAGWRGVVSGIVRAAVSAMTVRGSSPSELAVAVGPHLQRCCFEVGPEVAERFAGVAGAVLPPETLTVRRTRDDSVALNLAAAIHASLHDAGVREEQTFVATACTRCNPEFFHSYRRNGSGGPLMAAIAARRE
jgi:copper oxidase (laccase) domain-containing protein